MENEIDKIMSLFPKQSIENSVKAGKINATLKPIKDKIYTCVICSIPKEVPKSKYKDSYVMEIKIDGMTMSLFLARSMLFQLITEVTRNKITFKDLIGKEMKFVKTEQESKNYGKSEMYSIELFL